MVALLGELIYFRVSLIYLRVSSGNPLGLRLTPCKSMRERISLRQSRLRRRGSHNSVNDHSDEELYHLYTFFYYSTTSPGMSAFPVVEPTFRGRRSRLRTHLLLPPPPPLIRLMSDSEISDSDEEMAINFRAPGTTLTSPRVLGSEITASPEPDVIRLEPNSASANQTYFRRTANITSTHAGEDTELGQARARWANVIRGVEAAAALFDSGGQSITRNPSARSRRRRGALDFDPERELGFTSTSIWHSAEAASGSNSDISTILFEHPAVSLTPPPPELRDLPPASTESNDSLQNTPRPTVWGGSFANSDGYPSTSFWGPPATDDRRWTWTNELLGFELRERESGPARTFDPDGEFLEGLEGEWDEEMARLLGFSTAEEKGEGGDVATPTMNALLWM